MENLSRYDRTLFSAGTTPNDQLAIETCPGYNQALNKAAQDNYEWKPCNECYLQVRTFPATNSIVVNGECPKI